MGRESNIISLGLVIVSNLQIHLEYILGNCGTAIPRDMLPLDMLTPQIRHYELRQKISRYANFSDLSTPSYAIFDFFQKNSRYANFSDLSTPSYAIFD